MEFFLFRNKRSIYLNKEVSSESEPIQKPVEKEKSFRELWKECLEKYTKTLNEKDKLLKNLKNLRAILEKKAPSSADEKQYYENILQQLQPAIKEVEEIESRVKFDSKKYDNLSENEKRSELDLWARNLETAGAIIYHHRRFEKIKIK